MKPVKQLNTQLVEPLLWALLASLAAAAMLFFRPMPLFNDSYQYLTVAESFEHHHGMTSTLVHFDSERSHGRIPALLTTFPPGYPALIAVTSVSDNFATAARLVSCVCYVGTAALLLWALLLTGVPVLLRQFILFLFVTDAFLLDFATSVLSEPLYMLLSTAAVVALIASESGKHPARVVVLRAVLGYFLVGLAYWVRYAGLFLIAAVVSYALLQFIRQRNRIRAGLLLATLIPIGLAAVLMVRNWVSVGSWKGGNNLPVHHPLRNVSVEYIRAQLHLLFGKHAITFGVWEGLLLVGILGLAAVPISATGARGAQSAAARLKGRLQNADGATLLVALCALIYSLGIFYAGLRTMISFGTRMFLPILPLYLLLLGMALTWLLSRAHVSKESVWLKGALLLAAVGYAGINARDLRKPVPPAVHEILATEYAQPTATGQSLRAWIESNLAPGEPVLADDGQATGYLLHRPTVSMVEAQYSSARWECDMVKNEMKRFGLRYVILYKPSASAPPDPLLAESDFAATSASQQPSCGFVVAAENPYARILELASAAGPEQK